MRDGIVFYRSFYEAIKELPDEQMAACVRAIMDYGLDGKEPESAGIAKSIYLMAKPQIDANNQRYLNGSKGGRPKTERKPSDNQKKPKQTEQEPREEFQEPKEKVKEKEKEKDKDKDLKDSCPEVKSAPASPPAISFVLNDGSMYDITENDVVIYQQLYPGIDVMQNLRKIVGWCDANPKNRKTRAGAKRFVNAWLAREQDRATVKREPTVKPQSKNRFNNFHQRDYDFGALERQLQQKQMDELTEFGVRGGSNDTSD